MDFDLIITNGLLATASDIAPLDVAIKAGKISLLAPHGVLDTSKAAKVIDAEGAYVTPGGIDTHVHLEEPPLFGGKGRSSDTFETGTRSAICGGTTTIVAFAPQAKYMPSLLEVLKDCHSRAAGNCYADYSFHMLVGSPNPTALSEFPQLVQEGITSLKIYMTYEALQLRDDQILDVLYTSRAHGITTMIHAENGDVLNWMTRKLEERQLFAPVYHATSRPQIVETEATNRAIALAELMDAPILIVHVSSPSAAKHIRESQTRGLPVYAETCPQYLFLTRADMAKTGDHGFEGAKCVCSPPPRDGVEDHEGIWLGLRNGTFTVLSSDHCPFMYEDKEKGKKSILSPEHPVGRFAGIPNGIPGIETRLPLTMSANKLPMTKFVEVTATNAAKLYGLYPRKGAVLPGVSDADLVIWYPEGRIKEGVTNGMLHHNVDYTPFEGREVTNWPRYTVLRGEVVWDRDGDGLVGRKGYGEFVRRGKSSLPGPRGEEEFDVSKF
ncbi:dihydropyrimidinase [Cyphellophora europaea CBS 101466]|uniref:Dihydropyrimidinase n=1 Tax=Cyphellophora europaea (strain CBS 101466) TaxID=1220924 RepID=W2S3T9_CYPE1|nr:dihydropyrimidinase [Cyphellophora europaea CBS 101466]ETN42713.1 dihydropyrimidinase [Cyphellophora europaea CBS 101466]